MLTVILNGPGAIGWLGQRQAASVLFPEGEGNPFVSWTLPKSSGSSPLLALRTVLCPVTFYSDPCQRESESFFFFFFLYVLFAFGLYLGED